MRAPSIDPARVYRTPESRFADLPGFPWKPHYAHWGNLRYAYLDILSPHLIDLKTGSPAPFHRGIPPDHIQTETVLCLHGEPTWSYLYRKMIPGFLSESAPQPHVADSRRYIRRRVVVPDLIGFGRSDKPIDDDFYTFTSHRAWLVHFIQTHIVDHPTMYKDGQRVTLVVQDWGGILGLIAPSLFPDLFTHMIVMNTGLGLGGAPSKGWLAFRDYIKRTPDVDVGALIGRGTPLTPDDLRAFNAPYDGKHTKAGVRRFPQLVPVHPAMQGVAESWAALSYFRALAPQIFSDNSLTRSVHGSSLKVFVCVGAADPVLGLPVMEKLADSAFSNAGYHWHVIPEGGHFVQWWASDVPGLAEQAWAAEGTGKRSKDIEMKLSLPGKRHALVEWKAPKARSQQQGSPGKSGSKL